MELNPGPSTYEKKRCINRPPAISILELRLHQFGLKPLDVGGAHAEIVSLEQSHISYMEIQTVMALLALLG